MWEYCLVIVFDFFSFEVVKEFLVFFLVEESFYFKVGMEFYYVMGFEIVFYLKD